MQEESFTGVMAWVFMEGGLVGRKVKGMFEEFNRDLKGKAESEV